jgi:acyl-CoA reductase-like NAD-dependent aldehyde dehydrogenase
VSPTIIRTSYTPSWFRNEFFGPIVTLDRTKAEVVRLASATRYGLPAIVVTPGGHRASEY